MPDNRTDIFQQLVSLMKKYEKDLIVKGDGKKRYELWTSKGVVIAGRKRDEIYFAGMIVQSKYVSFYFMPVYTNPSMQSKMGKELIATLKGKACFHIKTLDKELISQLRQALDEGFTCYKKSGWV